LLRRIEEIGKKPDRPAIKIKSGRDLALSGSALAELMKEVLKKGYPFRFQARGWSMSPFIRDGDVITIIPYAHDRPRLGEIAAFIHPESLKPAVHRIIGKNSLACLIRGDNVSGSMNDGWIPKEKILGKVDQVERNGEKIWLGLRGPERYGIALFSRMGLLSFALRIMVKLKPHARTRCCEK
jgi:hypothetical protein